MRFRKMCLLNPYSNNPSSTTLENLFSTHLTEGVEITVAYRATGIITSWTRLNPINMFL